ncbi:hypothetical protein TWF694_005576 [Orbilia ellipsospora]|uniref:Nucleoside phosphorylase domain-containing protein n=1 Tax=Orbilia ellipsospora TaxID=2528407 RepID=A0AAV9WVL0_9PEZI
MTLRLNNSQAAGQQYPYSDYTIAWVTILEEEWIAAGFMLDEQHPRPDSLPNDPNSYKVGRIGRHNVVITRLPRAGTDAGSHAVSNLWRTFRNIRFVFLIGVGGGAPGEPVSENSNKEDLRLGDVVVAFQENENESQIGEKVQEKEIYVHKVYNLIKAFRVGFVLQYDFGKDMANGEFNNRSYIRKPQTEVINCMRYWKSEQRAGETNLNNFLNDSLTKIEEKIQQGTAPGLGDYRFPGRKHDNLHKVTDDAAGERAANISPELVTRIERKHNLPIVHYGLIACANRVMGDGRKREELRRKHGVMCFEMEAAGLMNDFPCIVIRGISDYSDGNKDVDYDWKPWASLTAAAAAKDLLSTIQPSSVETTRTVVEILNHVNDAMEERNKAIEAQKSIAKLKKRISFSEDLSKGLKDKYCQKAQKGTGEWMQNEEQFKNWTSDTPRNKVLWVCGKHGVGKSYLCALTIENIEEAYGKPSVIYAFIHKDERTNTNRLFCQLASQLLSAILDNATEIPEYLKDFLDLEKSDTKKIIRLISSLLLARSSEGNGPPTYIFVDGLDEREYFDKATGEDRPKEENYSFIKTLVEIANTPSTSIRLWFSSQPIGNITECFKDLGVPSIEITTEKTDRDVLQYLESAVPKSVIQDEESREVIRDYIEIRFNSQFRSDATFLWARSICHDLKEAYDEDSVKDILESVPSNLDGQYTNTMEKIKQKSKEGPNIRKSAPPVWKIVLSMLVFAYRPLRLFELMEGVAILRGNSENLKPPRNSQEILDACMSFTTLLHEHTIEIASMDYKTMESSIVVLCHSSVRQFLEARSDLACRKDQNSSQDELVSSRIIGQCCLRYFLQPRFKTTLEHTKDGTLRTGGELKDELNTNSLVFYAAKYWHLHFDTNFEMTELPGYFHPKLPAQEDSDIVIKFLESANFITCIQIQSIYVEGHFMQSYDSITDQATKRKQILPNWLMRFRQDLYCQFEEFISEWGELLQSGSSEYANGELDRCLWQALGDGHFFSKRSSRYNHVLFQTSSCCGSQTICSTRAQHISLDSDRFLSLNLCLNPTSPELMVNIWDLKTLNSPSVETPVTRERRNSWSSSYMIPQSHIPIKIDPKAENIDSYGGYTSKNFPIIPDVCCIIPPDAIAIFHDKQASLVRIGSKFFRISASEERIEESQVSEINSDAFLDPWEDLRFQGRYMVASRRRTDAHDIQSDFDCDFESSVYSSSEDEPWDDNDSVDCSASDEISDIKSTGVCSVDDRSDDLLYTDQVEEEDSTDDEILDETSDSDSEPDLEGPSRLYLKLSGFESDEDDKQKEALATLQYSRQRVMISEDQNDLVCTVERCNEKILKCWYKCPTCSSRERPYLICSKCKKDEAWCEDKNHQIYEMFNGKAIRVIANNTFLPKNLLDVFDTSYPQPKRVFSFSRRPESILYESPPAIHPTIPLVVWALCGEKILFADVANSEWRRHTIETKDVEGTSPQIQNRDRYELQTG